MRTIEAIQQDIDAKKKEMDNFELDNDDYEDQYNEALDDDGDIVIGLLTFSRSDILKQLDPTAYRCGLNDYVDGVEKEDDPQYKELAAELVLLECELEDAQAAADACL